MSKIHEYKGEQGLFVEAKIALLPKLVAITKMPKYRGSNKIEGIYTSDERLKKLVRDKITPHTRNGHKIDGYRDVLTTIHENFDYIPPQTFPILQLHRDLYKFSGTSCGGNYKIVDNTIAEMDTQANKTLRFQPVPASDVPAYGNFCQAYEEAVAKDGMDLLLSVSVFILDFLCSYPFNDGNNRMSRLLTLLLLYRAGYIVSKYISIEKSN